MEKGHKNDQEKIKLNLIPAKAIVELGKVFTFGSHKYGDKNWEKGISHSRLFAACLRHLYAYKSGETVDPESKLDHLSHALCNIVMLIEMTSKRPDLEDLLENKK